MEPAADIAAAFGRRARWRWPEAAVWLVAVGAALLLPDQLAVENKILDTALFALSLDLLVGYGGMVSLGHAAFFGIGAYAAGLMALHGWTEPLSALAAATLLTALLGLLTSFVLVHLGGVALLMVTMGMGLLMFELGNAAASITGGSDGMSGINPDPLLGLFPFDFLDQTAVGYSLVVTFLAFWLVRRIVNSPFGLSLQGYRENPARMAQIGAPMAARLRVVNTLAGGLAGLAGALLTQTTQFVGLDELSFETSAGVLIILIIGGGGRLYGGLVGAAIYTIGQKELAAISPQYWKLWLGAIIVLLMLFMPEGVLGGGSRLLARWRGRRAERAG